MPDGALAIGIAGLGNIGLDVAVGETVDHLGVDDRRLLLARLAPLGAEGDVGAYWGLWDKDGKLKYGK